MGARRFSSAQSLGGENNPPPQPSPSLGEGEEVWGELLFLLRDPEQRFGFGQLGHAFGVVAGGV